MDMKEQDAINLNRESYCIPQPLQLADTRDGFIHSLTFGTMYTNYSSKELENFNNERDFQVFLNYKGALHLIEYQH